MKLSYRDLFTGEWHQVAATVTTEHAASSYGIPVVVLEDGEAVDVQSWIILLYRVDEATPEEFEALKRALSPYTAPSAAAALGAMTSEKKATAARKNGLRGGRPPARVTDNMERGLWIDCGNGRIASAYSLDADYGQDAAYCLSFHNEGMPADKTWTYGTVPELVTAMREVEPDLRKWHLKEIDEA